MSKHYDMPPWLFYKTPVRSEAHLCDANVSSLGASGVSFYPHCNISRILVNYPEMRSLEDLRNSFERPKNYRKLL